MIPFVIEDFHQIPATIHNEDFYLHFFIILHFMHLIMVFSLFSF